MGQAHETASRCRRGRVPTIHSAASTASPAATTQGHHERGRSAAEGSVATGAPTSRSAAGAPAETASVPLRAPPACAPSRARARP